MPRVIDADGKDTGERKVLLAPNPTAASRRNWHPQLLKDEADFSTQAQIMAEYHALTVKGIPPAVSIGAATVESNCGAHGASSRASSFLLSRLPPAALRAFGSDILDAVDSTSHDGASISRTVRSHASPSITVRDARHLSPVTSPRVVVPAPAPLGPAGFASPPVSPAAEFKLPVLVPEELCFPGDRASLEEKCEAVVPAPLGSAGFASPPLSPTAEFKLPILALEELCSPGYRASIEEKCEDKDKTTDSSKIDRFPTTLPEVPFFPSVLAGGCPPLPRRADDEGGIFRLRPPLRPSRIASRSTPTESQSLPALPSAMM